MSCEQRIARFNALVAKKNNLKPVDILDAYEEIACGCRFADSDKEQFWKAVIEKLCGMETSFEDWHATHNWFYFRTKVPEFSKAIADKLASTATTFSDWHSIYRKHVFCAEHTQLAIEKMKALASTERELNIVIRSLQYTESPEEIGEPRIERSPSSLDEWLSMCRQSHCSLAQKTEILELIFTIDASLGVLYVHYKRSRKESSLRKYLARKIRAVDGTLEEWCRIYIETPEIEDLRSIALCKIKEAVMKK